MLKNTKKLSLNFQILRFFLIPTILISTPFFQKEKKRNFRNKIYFFLRPRDRNTELLRINLAMPKTLKAKLTEEKIRFCNVRIGGFVNRTKCLEDIPADIEINTKESGLRSIDIYPYKPIPTNKKSYAVVLKINNPNKSGLYQFHLYGQPKGNTGLSYLGSSTIVID